MDPEPEDLRRRQEGIAFIQSQDFRFEQTYNKILGFSPMLNNTCVVLAIKHHRLECVAHFSSDGQLLEQLDFENRDFYAYAILSDYQIAWLDVDRGFILHWNLRTYELEQIKFPFLDYSTCETHELFIFPENNLLCIAEWGSHSSNKFRLTYLKYPLQAEAEPVNVFDSDDCWTYECAVRRGNTSSMIIWFKSFHKQHIEFNTYELVMQNNQFTGERKYYQIQNPFGKENQSIEELSVGNIWQMTPNKYMVVGIRARPKQNGIYSNPLFVYEGATNNLRVSNILIEVPYRIKIIDSCSFGTTAMIKTFNFNESQAVDSPVYYIDNLKECLLVRQTWKCSHLYKYTFLGHDHNAIVDAEYQNDSVQKIVSKTIRVPHQDYIYADLLQLLLPEIADDLLSSTLEILRPI